MIVALDGPAASGKGTLARRLGQALDLPHLDTGLLYRATARAVLESGEAIANEAAALGAARALTLDGFDAEALRGKDMGEAASIVAAMPVVRAALIDLQRRFADRPGGAVLDGRDIGTVICPHADAKIFVLASPEARARRRFLELQARGERIDHADVLADILRRDERDSGRSTAPLKRADDAILLDTTDLDIDGAYAAALAIVRQRMGARARDVG